MGFVALERSQRLRQRADFAAVYRDGNRLATDAIVIRTLRTGRESTRFGFTTPKFVGGAVKRNRIRRRMRAIVSHLAVEPGWDVIVNVRARAASMDYAGLQLRMVRLLEKGGLLK